MNLPLSEEDRYYIVWVLLHQAQNALLRVRDKELSQYGISTIESTVLYAIHGIGGNATPAEIARWVFREHHTVTALLDRMEEKGLITRARDVDRKNMWRVSMTKKGQEAYQQSLKRESIHAILSTLSKAETQRLESYLRQIRDEALKYSVSEPTLPFP